MGPPCTHTETMISLQNTGLLAGALTTLAAGATAQTITPLVVEGDVLSIGTVTSTSNVDVNDSGDWLVELDTDNSDTSMDNAVLFNGAIIHQEGTDMGFPAPLAGNWVYDSFVDSMDINDNGDRLIHFNVEDVGATLSDRKAVVWTNGTSGTSYVLFEEDVTPCTVAGEPGGAVWDSIAEVWQNNNNTIVIAGRSNTDADDFMAVVVHDGAGTILSQTSFIVDNVIHSTEFPGSTGTHADTVQTIESSKHEFSINNLGQKMFHVDDQSFNFDGTIDYTAVDSHYYIDLQEISWEMNDAPTAGAFPFNHMSSAEVDLNDNGDWVAAWDDDGPTTGDGFILVNGAIFAQEGAPAPIGGGFVLEGVSFNNGGVQISDNGDVFWTAEWNDPDTTQDKGLYRNMELLVQEGVTMIGGAAVTDIRTSQGGDDMAVSDNGQFIIKEIHTTGSIEGVYMIQLPLVESYCFGDNSGTNCPCGNVGSADSGCSNSTLAGAILDASGSTIVANDDLVLSGSQLPPGVPSLFFQGTIRVNGGDGSVFGDGLLCAGGAIQRMQIVTVDGGGNAATTVPIASTFGATAGTTNTMQLWYRDPSGPCSGQFNTTNAVSVDWN